MNYNSIKEHGIDVEKLPYDARKRPKVSFEFAHESRKKTERTKEKNVDGPVVKYYQGNKCKCMTYSLASTIQYLLYKKIIYGVNDIIITT